MRQIASARLCTLEHPKFSADRIDELGPNHCQRAEVSVVAWGKLVYTGATRDLGDDLHTCEERLSGWLTHQGCVSRVGDYLVGKSPYKPCIHGRLGAGAGAGTARFGRPA